jgi:molybdate transport system substrate-binding protein
MRFLAFIFCALSLGCMRIEPDVVVFCASSMQDAVTQISKESRIPILMTPGGSDLLAFQISQGMRADILITADKQAMEIAGKQKEAVAFATSELAVAARKGLADFSDLGRAGLKIAVASKDVPAGRYAQSALNKLEPRLAEAIRKNIVFEEPSARSALQKLSEGEVDAAFVYNTDIQGLELSRIAIPAKAHQRATYYVVSLTARGKEFVSIMRTSSGWKALQDLGFGRP